MGVGVLLTRVGQATGHQAAADATGAADSVVERCCLLLGHLHRVSHAVLVKRPHAISVIFLSSLNGATG